MGDLVGHGDDLGFIPIPLGYKWKNLSKEDRRHELDF